MTVAEIISAAMELTLDQRVEIIAKLTDSLESQEGEELLDDAFAEELERRIADVDEGRVQLLDGEEVIRRIRANIGSRNKK